MHFQITRSRVFISRLFAVMILLLILFTGHSFSQESLIDVILESAGLFLVTTAAVGRLWSLMYIAGNKRQVLVTTGPYSIMRHPLYFFSLLGTLGIGLSSENILVFVCITVFFFSYYPFVIRDEEKKLISIFGQPYVEYMKAVPSIFPRFSLYESAEQYQVNTRVLTRKIGDALWFIWIFILLHFVEALQHWGYLPVLWRVP
jgi:protein-S-isoprenylcysteine O-methyltransferase Ste14